MHKGYIYIMTNPCLIDMVKIGYATNVEERRKQLSTTALPYDYEIYATYETSGKLEDKKLHKLIDNLNPDLRVSKNREFFIMSPEDAYELLEAIAIISGTVDKLKRAGDTSQTGAKQTRHPRPAINFTKCGIPMGAELVYVDDPTIKVVVENDRKVIYDNEIVSLTSAARKIMGVKICRGPAHFTYNGKLLTEIAENTQWKND